MGLRQLVESPFPVEDGPDLWSAQAYIRWMNYRIVPEACYAWFDCDYRVEKFPPKQTCGYHAKFRLPAAGRGRNS